MRFPKLSFKPEIIIAVASIITSVCALTISVVQTQIMQNQQHSSVWPYLEWLPSFHNHAFYIAVENKGIGPAIVKNVKITIDNKEVEGDNMSMDLKKYINAPDTLATFYSTLNKRVIKPGEIIRIIEIPYLSQGKKIAEALDKAAIRIEVTYQSIYGECWICRGTTIEKLKNCE
jgi:hypothetical protein